jgi:hypothetical protein
VHSQENILSHASIPDLADQRERRAYADTTAEGSMSIGRPGGKPSDLFDGLAGKSLTRRASP